MAPKGWVAERASLAPVREAEWVVYAKRPFAGPEQVLDYVGRYTHRVALSNNRLLDLADGQVSFRYKDYRHDAQQKTLTLEAEEFIRRFLLHVLPAGFQRIRYYGFLGNRYRKEKLARCRHLLGMPAYEAGPAQEAAPDYRERYEALTGVSLRRCPICHQGCMQVIEILPPSRRNRSAAPSASIALRAAVVKHAHAQEEVSGIALGRLGRLGGKISITCIQPS
jgi:hypothetical protein